MAVDPVLRPSPQTMNNEMDESYNPYQPRRTSNAGARHRRGVRHGGVHVLDDDNIDNHELQRKATRDGDIVGEVAHAAAKTETAKDNMVIGDTIEAVPYAAQFDLEDVTASNEAASRKEEDIVGRLLRE